MVFFTALFTVLGANIGIILSGIFGLGAAYVILSPNGRLIIKGFFRWVFASANNDPRIAAGIYDEKLSELRKVLETAVKLNQQANGELADSEENLENAKDDYEEYSGQAKRLETQGDHEEALLIVKKAMLAKTAISEYEKQIPIYQNLVTSSKERVTEVQWKISEVEQQKKLTLDSIKKGRLEEKIANELSGINVSEIDATLESIAENARNIKNIGVGARLAYENSDQKVLQAAINKANTGDAEDFLKKIINDEETK